MSAGGNVSPLLRIPDPTHITVIYISSYKASLLPLTPSPVRSRPSRIRLECLSGHRGLHSIWISPAPSQSELLTVSFTLRTNTPNHVHLHRVLPVPLSLPPQCSSHSGVPPSTKPLWPSAPSRMLSLPRELCSPISYLSLKRPPLTFYHRTRRVSIHAFITICNCAVFFFL